MRVDRRVLLYLSPERPGRFQASHEFLDVLPVAAAVPPPV